MLPLLADRPVSRFRWPNGVDAASFVEKSMPQGAPDWVADRDAGRAGSLAARRITYPSSTAWPPWSGWRTWPRSSCTCRSGRSARAVASATRTGWSSTSTPARPRACPSAPRWRCWCASGSPPTAWTASRSPAAARACSCTRRCPASRTPTWCASTPAGWPSRWPPSTARWSSRRWRRRCGPGKVLLDWSQNHHAKTTICPYSLRGRAAAERRRPAHLGRDRGRRLAQAAALPRGAGPHGRPRPRHGLPARPRPARPDVLTTSAPALPPCRARSPPAPASLPPWLPRSAARATTSR